MYRKTLRINLFGIEPPVEEALRRAAPLDRFEHAVEAFPTVDGEAFCSCDIAVVDLRLFAGSPGGARPSRCLADLAARRRERLDTFYSAVAVVADAAEAARWTPEDYRVIDALWTGPLDGTRAAFELARLQRSAKRDADLALAQQYLDTAIDSIPELVWFKDAHGAHLKVTTRSARRWARRRTRWKAEDTTIYGTSRPTSTRRASSCAWNPRRRPCARTRRSCSTSR